MATLIRLTCLLTMCVMVIASSQRPPGRPINVSILEDSRHISVQWDPPAETYGVVRKYIVTFRILPETDEKHNVVDNNMDVRVSLIPILSHVGRLFMVRVRAQNDAGLGDYSVPRYIRTGCGQNVKLKPLQNVSIISPGFLTDTPSYEPGVLCSWHFSTYPFYSLTYSFKTLDFGFLEDLRCNDTYVNVTFAMTTETYCRNGDYVGKTFFSNASVVFRSGYSAKGRGFSLSVNSVVKLPGQPTAMASRASRHALVVSWQPPIEKSLPITSYILRYSIASGFGRYELLLSPLMLQYPIYNSNLAGKLLMVTVAGRIGDKEGPKSPPLFARAPCHTDIILIRGVPRNITSPNYPDPYPNNIICTWNIATEPGNHIRVTFHDFQLEDSFLCSNDFLAVNGNINKFCIFPKLPKTLERQDSYVNLKLFTDSEIQFRGFFASVSTVDAVTSTYTPTMTSQRNITIYRGDGVSPTLKSFFETTSEIIASLLPVIKASTFVSSLNLTSQGDESRTSGAHPVPNQNLLSTSLKAVAPTNVISPVSGNSSDVTAGVSNMNMTEYSEEVMDKNSNTSPIEYKANTTMSKASNNSTQSRNSAATFNSTAQNNVNFTYSHMNKSFHASPQPMSLPGNSNHEYITPVVASSICGLLVLCVLSLVFWVYRRRRIKKKVQIENRKRAFQVEMHDIVPEMGVVSTSHTEIWCTSFSKLPALLRRSLKRASTLPTPGRKEREKVREGIEQSMNNFGSFISDKDSLEKRLKMKHKKRRTNSV